MDMTVTNSRCKRLVSRAVVYLGHVQAQPAYSHGFKWRELSLTNLPVSSSHANYNIRMMMNVNRNLTKDIQPATKTIFY